MRLALEYDPLYPMYVASVSWREGVMTKSDDQVLKGRASPMQLILQTLNASAKKAAARSYWLL
jgi:hypothetical protein